MPFAQLSDGAQLYYEEHGSGPPLMMVAGLGGLGSYWGPQIERFAKHYRVILHDHRGTGQSTRSQIDYSLEQMARDTLELMDALGLEKADFVGHSTGASIGEILAVTDPDRIGKLVLASGWTKADGFFRRCFEVRRELLLSAGPQAYIKATPLFLHANWFIRDNIEEIERWETSVYGGDHDVGIMRSRIDALLAYDWTDRLAEIAHDVLVVGVANDNLTPAYFSEALAEIIPDAKLVIMDDGGHAASQTMPEAFNDIVLDFLLEGKAS